MYSLQDLNGFSTELDLRRALFDAIGVERMRQIDRKSYYMGKVVKLGGRGVYFRHRHDTFPRFAFTAEEIAAAGDPPLLVLETVAISSTECPTRATANVPELRAQGLCCCQGCFSRTIPFQPLAALNKVYGSLRWHDDLQDDDLQDDLQY